MSALDVQVYEHGPAAFRDYDPVFAEVAALLIQAIEDRNPRLHVDHVGSTSVPECRGKGVIDLAVTYVEGGLKAAKGTLDSLGFQRQTGPDPFPETRPMRVAAVIALGATFQVHAHVIANQGGEHRELIAFRDWLRSDPRLCRAYEEQKRRIVESGVTDPLDYCKAKNSFIVSALARIAAP